MSQLVECVPNFSEGRDQEVIGAITAAIEAVSGAELLDVDPGADTNRTVVTLVGAPEAVIEAAFQAIRTAAERIDMRRHDGAHPRLGATDVCPLVPVAGVTRADCVELARRLGQRVGDELGIPVFLYEHAATRPERRNLATIRQGEYEGLAAKLADPDWQPDFGPARFNPPSGATVIGVREFLIAYNVNLNTRDRKWAHDIALSIREQGRNKRGPDGKFVRDADGVPIKEPGTLPACKAVGWYIDTYQMAQISINLTDFHVTPPHVAFDECCRQAAARGLRVTGSELVGLIPLAAMLEAGRHYLRQQQRSTGVPEAELVRMAVQSMGLAELGPFDAEQKIIEYRIRRPGRLASMTVHGFADELSSDSPAPGGGSVAALCGALGAALAAMVANLTIGVKKYRKSWEAMQPVAEEGQALKDFFLAAIDRDTEAFDGVLAALRQRAQSAAERTARQAAIQAATREAIRVPLGVLERTPAVIELARCAAAAGNPGSLSDAGVAALAARAAARGAYYNVLINLESITDSTWAAQTLAEARRRVAAAEQAAAAVTQEVERRLAPAAAPAGSA